MIDVKYRRVHTQQSVFCNKAITRRNATHLSWSSEHAPRCGILWIRSIDRSIGGNNVASRHGRVPVCREGKKQNEKLKRKEKARSWPRARPPLCNDPSSSEPCTFPHVYPPSSIFPVLFFFSFIYQQFLRSITIGNFQS